MVVDQLLVHNFQTLTGTKNFVGDGGKGRNYGLNSFCRPSSDFYRIPVTQFQVVLRALLLSNPPPVLLPRQPPPGSLNDCRHQSFSSFQLADLAILEEVIRMVLEIINSCVTNTLHHNPNLVYTLLHRRELFAQFRTHPTFQDIIQNIDTVSSTAFASAAWGG